MKNAATLLLINVHPNHPLAMHAYRYAQSFLKLHSDSDGETGISNDLNDPSPMLRIFFYGDAAHTGNALNWQTADQSNLTQLWSTLSQKFNQNLQICVSTALARGVTDVDNAKRHQLDNENLALGFKLVGLGELADHLSTANKVISF